MKLFIDVFTTALVVVFAVFFATLVILGAYTVWCFVIAPAIGRTAGAIDRRLRPVTDEERRLVLMDERAARDLLRPHGSVDGISTINAPNGYDWRDPT